MSLSSLARPERFELPTSWFVAMRSIQLSYGRTGKRFALAITSQPGAFRGLLLTALYLPARLVEAEPHWEMK
jgi:hypothetical protein